VTLLSAGEGRKIAVSIATTIAFFCFSPVDDGALASTWEVDAGITW
jgi:hypothetical protein